MSSNAKYVSEFTQKYRGYTIKPGSVWKDGDAVAAFYSPLEAKPEEMHAAGRKIVDELIEREGV